MTNRDHGMCKAVNLFAEFVDLVCFLASTGNDPLAEITIGVNVSFDGQRQVRDWQSKPTVAAGGTKAADEDI
jgi:hypothetical protein